MDEKVDVSISEFQSLMNRLSSEDKLYDSDKRILYIDAGKVECYLSSNDKVLNDLKMAINSPDPLDLVYLKGRGLFIKWDRMKEILTANEQYQK